MPDAKFAPEVAVPTAMTEAAEKYPNCATIDVPMEHAVNAPPLMLQVPSVTVENLPRPGVVVPIAGGLAR